VIVTVVYLDQQNGLCAYPALVGRACWLGILGNKNWRCSVDNS